MRLAIALSASVLLASCAAFRGDDAGGAGADTTMLTSFEESVPGACSGAIVGASPSMTPTNGGYESATSCVVCATSATPKGSPAYIQIDTRAPLAVGTYEVSFYARRPATGASTGNMHAQLRQLVGAELVSTQNTGGIALGADFERHTLTSNVTRAGATFQLILYASDVPGQCIDVDAVALTKTN